MFEWFSSVKSCVKAGVDPSNCHFWAFNRIDLADMIHCAPNVGIAGPSGANFNAWPLSAVRIPGWSGRWPKSLALDAKGWVAVPWGSPRNLWRWWPP